MNGHASFNQVFFTDADGRAGDCMVCDVGDGWTVATTTLMHERRGADGLRSWAQASNRKGRIYEEETRRDRHHHGALQVVSAARRPRRPA